MKFPEYRYVDVAVGGAHNRNKLYDVTKLGDPSNKNLFDTYMTYFRYNREMIEYFRKGQMTKKGLVNTVMGFPGSAYSDYIPVDIDVKDLEKAKFETIRFLEILQSHDVDLNQTKIYFSGSKGFHVLLPCEMMQVEPSPDIHKKYRRFIKRLTQGKVKCDTSIYDKVRLFRVPNTINSKSGKYKIQLYPFELYNATIDEILEMANHPREEWEPDEPEYHEVLAEMYWSEEQTEKTGTTEGVKVKLCMHKMMQGVNEGERDNVGLRVAVHLKMSGLSPKMIWVALNEWNRQNNPPLDEHEIERIFHQGLQQYEFGCRDHILQAYCDKKCLFYKG